MEGRNTADPSDQEPSFDLTGDEEFLSTEPQQHGWDADANTINANMAALAREEMLMLELPAGSVMRVWTGWIRPERRQEYQDYIERTGLAAYRSTPGNLGAVIAFRDLSPTRCEVRTVSFWRSRDDIVAFAGDDIEQAVFYPEDDDFLIDRETTVAHFDVG